MHYDRKETEDSPKKTLKNSSHPYALTTSVFWSLAYVLTRVCTQVLTPLQTGFLRLFIASVIMILIILIRKIPFPKGKDLGYFIASGLFGFTLYMTFFNKGCSMVTTATGNVILAFATIITAVGARVLFHEKLSWLQWVSIFIAFAGVVILACLGGAFTVNRGILWLFLAVCALSTYNLLQRFLGRMHDSLSVTAWSILFGTVFLSFLAPSSFRSIQAAPPRVWICLLILGSCCSGIAYLCWSKAFSLANRASSVSNYACLNPFISTIFGFIFIGDPVEPSAIYGGSVIMIGLLLYNFAPQLLKRKTETGNGKSR